MLLLALALFMPAHAGAAPPQGAAPAAVRDPAEIERQLLAAVRADPNSVKAHQSLAAFYLHFGRLNEAIPHLRRLYALNADPAVAGYDLARALLEIGNPDDARAVVRQMLDRKDSSELHNLLGDIEERAGHLAAAAEEFQRAAHMDATEEHLFDWGNIHLRLRGFDNAFEVFAAAVARYPQSARLHIGLGIAQYSRGNYRAAVESFCRAVDIDPSDPRPYDFLGEIYGIAPDLGPEVTERLAGFVTAHPQNANAHLYYALSLWKGQRPAADSTPIDVARVESLLRKAVALDPALARGFLELGILLSDQKRYEEAIAPLLRATQLEPDAAQTHYRLAQAYRRTGRTTLAEESLEKFQQLKAAAPR